MERGDLVKITWVDITEDPVGDPGKAALSERISYGLYWEEREDKSIPVLVTTTTIDSGDPSQQGYCIYPRGCIREIEVIKRRKQGRKKPSAASKALQGTSALGQHSS